MASENKIPYSVLEFYLCSMAEDIEQARHSLQSSLADLIGMEGNLKPRLSEADYALLNEIMERLNRGENAADRLLNTIRTAVNY